MTDIKQTIQELEMLKGFHESIIDESKNVKEIRVYQGCLVAINHAIKLIEEQEERIAIMLEGQPEVVRCKNCKYRNEELRDECNHWLPCMEIRTEGDWFCADGERREDK